MHVEAEGIDVHMLFELTATGQALSLQKAKIVNQPVHNTDHVTACLAYC